MSLTSEAIIMQLGASMQAASERMVLMAEALRDVQLLQANELIQLPPALEQAIEELIGPPDGVPEDECGVHTTLHDPGVCADCDHARTVRAARRQTLYWRGSVSDLVTDIKALLTVEQLAELTGESAIAWQERVREGKRKP